MHGTVGYRRLWQLILDDRRQRYQDPSKRLHLPHASPTPETEVSAWPFPETYETFKQLKQTDAPLYENLSTVESVDLLLNYDVMPFVRRLDDTPSLVIVRPDRATDLEVAGDARDRGIRQPNPGLQESSSSFFLEAHPHDFVQ